MSEDINKFGNDIIKAVDIMVVKRGKVIDLAIEVESCVTEIIASCFFPIKEYGIPVCSLDENGIALKSLVLNNIHFREKIKIFKDVMEVKRPDIVIKYKQFIKLIITKLEKVGTFRNLLAHSEIDVSRLPENQDDFNYIKCKNGQLIKSTIKEDEYRLNVGMMLKLIVDLWMLYKLFNSNSELVLSTEENLYKRYPSFKKSA